jgi:hypothetical protein
MTGIDQEHGKSTRLQQLEYRNPKDAGRFHRDRFDPAALKPIGHRYQVFGKAPEFAHRFIVAIRRHRHEVARRTNVDPCSIRIHQLKDLLAYGHATLHHYGWNAAPVRVRRNSSLFSAGCRICSIRLTNVADVTQDHARKAGKTAPMGHRSSPARHSATIPLPMALCFCGTPSRQRRVTSLVRKFHDVLLAGGIAYQGGLQCSAKLAIARGRSGRRASTGHSPAREIVQSMDFST